MIGKARLVSVVTALIACLLLVTALWVESRNDARHAAETRAEAFADVSLLGARLEALLVADVHLVHGLAAVVAANPRLTQEDFSRAAGQVFGFHSSITSLSTAPDMVIRHVYPRRDNEKAVGLDLGRHPTQANAANAARSSRKIIVAGPLDLVQGGRAFVSRIPVFLDAGAGSERFWGLVSAVIDPQKLFEAAGMLDANLPYEIALRGSDGRGANGEVFFGRRELFDADPVIVDIALPFGHWQAAAIPRGGWPTQAPNAWRLRAGFVLVTLLILGPFLGLGRSMRALGVAQTRLNSERRRFNATLENTPNVGVQWYRRDGTVIYWNHASEAIYGWSAEEMKDGGIGRILLAEDHERFIRVLSEVGAGGGSFGPAEFHVVRRDGEQRIVLSTIFAIPGADESILVCTDIDVTESRRLERMQRETLNSMPDAIVVVDGRGMIIQVNQQTLKLFGYTASELVGAPVETLMRESLRGAHGEHRERYFKEARIREMGTGLELTALTRDGREIPVDVCLGPIHTDTGVFVIATLRDISERKRVMAELRAARDRAQRYLDTVQATMLSLDRDGRVIMINRHGCEQLGYAEAELVGRDWFATCLPEDVAQSMRSIFGRVMSGEHDAAGSFQNAVVCRDGRQRLIAWRNARLYDEDGRIVGLLSSGEDVTDRVEAENRLIESEQRFSFAVEGAGDGVWDWNLETDIMLCSRSCMAMFGGEEEERHCIDDWIKGVHPGDRGATLKARDEYVAGRTSSFVSEFRMRGRVGDYKWILCRATIVARDPEGKPTRMIGIQTDISARKQAEEDLRLARDAAEEASRAKSRFLANMSHELRTPLNAIIGFAQMLDMGAPAPLHDAQREPVGHILGSGRHLLQIINDLLDLARIETGRLEMVIETLSLAPTIAEVVNLCGPAADARHVVIRHRVTKYIAVRADRVRLRQVLLNLLSNAVKYNCEGGTVDVGCSQTADLVRIVVTDTGPGIPAERRDEAFLPFHRLGAENGVVEGSGIGLAVTKQLVEAMRGRVGIADHDGPGSSFWIELPADNLPEAVTETQALAVTVSDVVPGKVHTVLYVEDNPVNLRLMQHVFTRRKDLQLITATTAEGGLHLARQWRPALILMDINLPGMDGYAALRELRSDPVMARIPVVAVTANAMKGDRERAEAAGFAEYLTKPLNIGSLYLTLDRYIEEPEPAVPDVQLPAASADGKR